MSTSGSTTPGGIVAEGLVKHFDGGAVQAVRGLSFTIDPGELFGLIGPDGAGKTTLLRLLVTVMLPDAGRATVDGLDIVGDYRALRERIGYMPGRFSLYPDLSVEENLRFFASVFGTTLEEGYDLIAPIYAQIEPFKTRRAGALSGGMKQKLALSCALVHRPRVLFLDEPTTGVDAVSRREFWDMLDRLKAEGITLLVSTPYMDEAARCDRVALIQDGHLLRAPDTPDAVAASLTAPLLAVRAQEKARLITTLRSLPHARSAHAFGESVHYTDEREQADPGDVAEEVQHALRGAGLTDAVAAPTAPTIEDAFMALMTLPEAAPDG